MLLTALYATGFLASLVGCATLIVSIYTIIGNLGNAIIKPRSASRLKAGSVQ